MAARPIMVLCEGPHDVAFLTRLLEASVAAARVDLPVDQLPAPFGDFFISRLKSRNANLAKVGGSGPVAPDEPPLLEAVWKSADGSRFWYFLNCCGDKRASQINLFLKPLVAMAEASDPVKRLAELGVVFVNDADDMGITERQNLITSSHAAMLAPLFPDFPSVKANSSNRKDGYGAGTCISSAPSSDKGSLENIVWALWSAGSLERRDKSRALMDSFATAGTKIGPGSTPSKILKAALTTAGQSECPGYSLAVILRDTKALDVAAMKADALCRAFVKVLTEV